MSTCAGQRADYYCLSFVWFFSCLRYVTGWSCAGRGADICGLSFVCLSFVCLPFCMFAFLMFAFLYVCLLYVCAIPLAGSFARGESLQVQVPGAECACAHSAAAPLLGSYDGQHYDFSGDRDVCGFADLFCGCARFTPK